MNICIYHGGCTDGVAAAWVFWKYLRERLRSGSRDDWHFYPGVYQKEPPLELIDAKSEVLLVDFSYKNDIMDTLVSRASVVSVLDHHKTAQADLEPLINERKLQGVFDMNRCGALLAWDRYFMTDPPPSLLSAIDAQDRFTKDRDAPLIMALRSYPHVPDNDSPEAFDALMETWDRLMKPETMTELRADAAAIYRYYRARVEETKPHADAAVLLGLEFPLINAPFYLASDVAGELAANAPAGFAGVWWRNRDGTVTFSLRSRGDFDVAKLASKFGGGGHANAAGFRMPWKDFAAFMASQ